MNFVLANSKLASEVQAAMKGAAVSSTDVLFNFKTCTRGGLVSPPLCIDRPSRSEGRNPGILAKFRSCDI